MISFIIPAHNEEAVLPRTLETLMASARALGEEFEILVVDDASTDRTAQVAESNGARVVPVNLRQIAAVRNAGARAARGEVLFFIDADTLVSDKTLRAARAALNDGAIGGGATVQFEQNAPRMGRLILWLLGQVWFRLRWAAGCFVFARREAFEKIGGFDETYFCGEEIYISKALKQQGKFVIVPEPVITSARKFRTYSACDLLSATMRLSIGGPESWKKRENAGVWYEGRREG